MFWLQNKTLTKTTCGDCKGLLFSVGTCYWPVGGQNCPRVRLRGRGTTTPGQSTRHKDTKTQTMTKTETMTYTQTTTKTKTHTNTTSKKNTLNALVQRELLEIESAQHIQNHKCKKQNKERRTKKEEEEKIFFLKLSLSFSCSPVILSCVFASLITLVSCPMWIASSQIYTKKYCVQGTPVKSKLARICHFLRLWHTSNAVQ